MELRTTAREKVRSSQLTSLFCMYEEYDRRIENRIVVNMNE